MRQGRTRNWAPQAGVELDEADAGKERMAEVPLEDGGVRSGATSAAVGAVCDFTPSRQTSKRLASSTRLF